MVQKSEVSNRAVDILCMPVLKRTGIYWKTGILSTCDETGKNQQLYRNTKTKMKMRKITDR